jgi:hypothetical protein
LIVEEMEEGRWSGSGSRTDRERDGDVDAGKTKSACRRRRRRRASELGKWRERESGLDCGDGSQLLTRGMVEADGGEGMGRSRGRDKHDGDGGDVAAATALRQKRVRGISARLRIRPPLVQYMSYCRAILYVHYSRSGGNTLCRLHISRR